VVDDLVAVWLPVCDRLCEVVCEGVAVTVCVEDIVLVGVSVCERDCERDVDCVGLLDSEKVRVCVTVPLGVCVSVGA
jgi:hypothetical protein